MSWIKKFADGSYSLAAGQPIEGFQPIDFYHFFPLWYGLWIPRIAEAIIKLNAEHKTYQELKHLLPTPSNTRSKFQKIIPTYKGWVKKDAGATKIVTNFYARMLQESCPEDPFGKTRNPFHTKEEVTNILKNASWQPANPDIARKLGQLITAAGSLVHGLYNDLGTDYGWDAYGPYETNDGTLLIRDFPDFQPTELWPNHLLGPIKSLQIYGLYKDVAWEIGCVGCHTIVRAGSPITGLKKYSVVIDGKVISEHEIDTLIQKSAASAEQLYKIIRQKTFEELKQMVMLQECFQVKKLLDAAGVDWRPTPAMVESIDKKPLATNVVPHGKMVTTMEEYLTLFNFKYFAREVLSEHI